MSTALALALTIGLSGAPADGSNVPPAALGLPAAPAREAEPPTPTEPEPVETTAEAPPHRHLASWILLGLGGAGLLAGGALNLASASSANGNPTAIATGVPSPTPQSNSLWTGALISYGVGAALGLTGAVVYYFETRHD